LGKKKREILKESKLSYTAKDRKIRQEIEKRASSEFVLLLGSKRL
jgi:hypothetical protein